MISSDHVLKEAATFPEPMASSTSNSARFSPQNGQPPAEAYAAYESSAANGSLDKPYLVYVHSRLYRVRSPAV